MRTVSIASFDTLRKLPVVLDKICLNDWLVASALAECDKLFITANDDGLGEAWLSCHVIPLLHRLSLT